jgi:hypothetical protein
MRAGLLLLSLSTAAAAGDLSLTPVQDAVAPLVLSSEYRASGTPPTAPRTIASFVLNGLNGAKPTDMSSVGASPLVIKTSQGTCIRVELVRDAPAASGRVSPSSCSRLSVWTTGQPIVPPQPRLLLRNASAGFAAWRDEQSGQTYISDLWNKNQIVLTTKADVLRISAIRSPDRPAADLALLIKYKNRYFITFNDVAF